MKAYVKPHYSNGLITHWTARPHIEAEEGSYILPTPVTIGTTEEEALERFKVAMKDDELNGQAGKVVEV